MNTQRYVTLGIARPRSAWFASVAAWSNGAVVPIEFLKCVSAAEVLARAQSARSISSALLDESAAGVDRDLIDQLTSAGIATCIVTSHGTTRDWHALGASEVLVWPFSAATLTDTLERTATPIPTHSLAAVEQLHPDLEAHIDFEGSLVAVCGSHGAGASTLAMALAQGVAQQLGSAGSVALVDLRLPGDLAMYHDQPDAPSAVMSLVEAHRGASLGTAATESLLMPIPERGYDVLWGARRSREWTALRPRAVQASMASLTRAYRYVIADCDHELDGEPETGSVDLEERNCLTRTAIHECDLCVVVTRTDMKSVYDCVRIVRELVEHNVGLDSILVVFNSAPRSPAHKAGLTATLRALLGDACPVTSPIFVARKDLEGIHRRVAPLPSSVVNPICSAVLQVLDRASAASRSFGVPPQLHSFHEMEQAG